MEHKKNILIVHNYYQQPGGEDTVVANEMKLLKDHGHKVYLYTRNNSEIKTYSIIQKLGMCFNTFFSIKTYHEVRDIIIKEKIDILHVHNTLNLISPSVYYAGFSCQIPVIQTMHNFRLLCPAATFYRDGHICENCISRGIMCSIKNKCYRNSRIQTIASVMNLILHKSLGTYRRVNFICLTEFNKDKLLYLNSGRKEIIDESRVYIKPNFTFDVIKKQNINQEDYYVFVGRLEEIKGTKVLLKAFKENKKKLLIIGDGEQRNTIEKYISYHKLQNITMTGQVSHDQVNDIVQKAKALIVPSQCYETFGMVIIEAYANSVPVIAGNIGNIGMLVDNGETGCIFKYNSWKSLNRILERIEIYNSMQLKEKSYQTFCDKYSEESNYTILKGIYENVRK